jgi:hypothetical protein
MSVRNGDKPETAWIIHLAHPICVDEDKTEPDLNPAQKNIQKVQLVFLGGGGYTKYKELVSKEVVATGTLFGSHTGHHHTAVLLTVRELAKAK